LTFAIALWLLASLRFTLTLIAQETELRTYLYLGRLVAYSLILGAIIHKNRESRRRSAAA
jgi:hypothetical protein